MTDHKPASWTEILAASRERAKAEVLNMRADGLTRASICREIGLSYYHVDKIAHTERARLRYEQKQAELSGDTKEYARLTGLLKAYRFD